MMPTCCTVAMGDQAMERFSARESTTDAGNPAQASLLVPVAENLLQDLGASATDQEWADIPYVRTSESKETRVVTA